MAKMMANSMPEDYAKMLAELDTVIKNGGEEKLNGVVLSVTGRPSRGLEDFMDEGGWRRVFGIRNNAVEIETGK